MADTTKIRRNYRLDPVLVHWAQRYAKLRGIPETSVVESALREAMDSDQHIEAVARRIIKKRGLRAADL